jgi:hypothetical protein
MRIVKTQSAEKRFMVWRGVNVSHPNLCPLNKLHHSVTFRSLLVNL